MVVLPLACKKGPFTFQTYYIYEMRKGYTKQVLISLLFLSNAALGQKFNKDYFGQELQKKTYDIDAQADAVVLFEKCAVEITPDGTGYKEKYTIHRIVHILKSSATSIGNVTEQYRDKNNHTFVTDSVWGITYNLTNGKTVESPLAKTGISTKIPDKLNTQIELAMPNVTEGSIIEYHYQIKGPVTSLLPQWEFQNKLPKLYSEFALDAPADFKFKELNPPITNFTAFSTVEDAEKSNAISYKINVAGNDKKNKILWVKKNLTGLKPEMFFGNLENARELFQLQIDGFNMNEMSENWQALNNYFLRNEHFGEQFTKSFPEVKKITDSLIRNKNTPLQKAKSIYSYVRANFDCNNNPGINVRRDLSQIVKNRIASEAEMNLLLTNMLRTAGLNASAVILAKLGSPKPNEFYPELNQFNYAIATVKIDTQQIFLDASNSFNIFGVLPIYCHNGYARIIDTKGSSIKWSNKDYKDRNKQEIVITELTDSNMEVGITETKGITESIYLRNIMSKDSNAISDYIIKRTSSFQSDIIARSLVIDNLDDVDKTLVLKYSFKAVRRKKAADKHLPTDFLRMFNSNPFAAPQRKLPVDFPSTFEYNYSLKVLLPYDDWEADQLPASWSGGMTDNSVHADHITAYDTTAHIVTIKTNVKINEPRVAVSSYDELHTFFEKFVKETSGQVTFKKAGK